jgi:integrase
MGRIKTNVEKQKKKRVRGRPFTVFPKVGKYGQKSFYVQFRQPNGKLGGTAKCTGEDTQGRAEEWAMKYLATGQIVTKENVTFESYSKDFFKIDGKYAEGRKARGKVFSERRLDEQASKLKNHLIPTFGKCRLTDIDYEKIDRFQRDMLRKGKSGDTTNGATDVLRIILTEAFKEKLIQTMPIFERVGVNSKPRGVLTDGEVKEIFKIAWAGFENKFLELYSLEARTGNLLAAATGLRQGEIICLKRSAIHKNYIEVLHSWDNIYHKVKDPKTEKSKRYVPIPTKVFEKIEEVMKNAKWTEPDDFLFQGEKRKRPMNPEILRDALYEMMVKIEIDEAARVARSLTFHSWRHFFNSMLINNQINKFKVQSLTGHVTDAMTANYYHADEYKDVLDLQEKIFIN